MYSGVFYFAGFFVLFEFSLAATRTEVLILQTVLCDEDMKDTGNVIEKCFDVLQVPSKFDKMTTECCPGFDNRKNGSMIRAWYCENELETVMKCNTCQEAKLKENGEEEEMKNITMPFRECVRKSMLSKRK